MQNWNKRTPTWRSVVLILVGVLMGAMFITPSVAHISNTVNHLWKQHIRPKSDNRYINVGEKATDASLLDGLDSAAFFRSARVMWAQVAFNGTLLTNASKGATASAKVTTGRYNVDFPRSLLDCSFVATAHDVAAGREVVAEYGEYADPALDFDTIRVAVNDSSGAAVDEPFSLIVLCTTG